MHGCQVGFFRGDVKLLTEDMQTLRPTLFITVPRLLNRIYDKVLVSCHLFNCILLGNVNQAHQ